MRPSRDARRFPIWLRRTRSCRPWSTASTCRPPPDQVWALIGQFGGTWHPLIAKIQLTGTGIGQLRTIETIDGKQIIERLEAIDDYAKILSLHDDQRRSSRRITPERWTSSRRGPAAPSSGACSIGRMANPTLS